MANLILPLQSAQDDSDPPNDLSSQDLSSSSPILRPLPPSLSFDSPQTKTNRPLTMQEHDLLLLLARLKEFLATAPTRWSPPNAQGSVPVPNPSKAPALNRFALPSGEFVTCVLWQGLYHITGTDIVRALVFRFEAFGRPVRNMKKFEEGVFSDLRNLKPGVDASLEEPKSPFLDLLYKYQCIRTQKKQKVFYWFSVPHDRLFLDALERDLKREKMGIEPSTEIVGEPAQSFSYDASSGKSLWEEWMSKVKLETAIPSIASTPLSVAQAEMARTQGPWSIGGAVAGGMLELFEGSPSYKQRRKRRSPGHHVINTDTGVGTRKGSVESEDADSAMGYDRKMARSMSASATGELELAHQELRQAVPLAADSPASVDMDSRSQSHSPERLHSGSSSVESLAGPSRRAVFPLQPRPSAFHPYSQGTPQAIQRHTLPINSTLLARRQQHLQPYRGSLPPSNLNLGISRTARAIHSAARTIVCQTCGCMLNTAEEWRNHAGSHAVAESTGTYHYQRQNMPTSAPLPQVPVKVEDVEVSLTANSDHPPPPPSPSPSPYYNQWLPSASSGPSPVFPQSTSATGPPPSPSPDVLMVPQHQRHILAMSAPSHRQAFDLSTPPYPSLPYHQQLEVAGGIVRPRSANPDVINRMNQAHIVRPHSSMSSYHDTTPYFQYTSESMKPSSSSLAGAVPSVATPPPAIVEPALEPEVACSNSPQALSMDADSPELYMDLQYPPPESDSPEHAFITPAGAAQMMYQMESPPGGGSFHPSPEAETTEEGYNNPSLSGIDPLGTGMTMEEARKLFEDL